MVDKHVFTQGNMFPEIGMEGVNNVVLSASCNSIISEKSY
jgi:hypothetical protein